jgi:beta-galactosidase GanA
MRSSERLCGLALASLFALALGAGCAGAQNNPPIPRIEHAGGEYHFLVDGKPFLMLGGQAHNSSATNPKDLEPVWASLDGVGANTAEVPLYWELIEPEPGKFDFSLVDSAIDGARRHNLRLVFLWFASWKNGEMHYTPAWLKKDPEKYRRVINIFGQPMEILSPLCETCRDADASAFARLMQHIKNVDQDRRTVIMMQVENETGLLGTDRNYSKQATRLFGGLVPAELMDYLELHRTTLSSSLKAAWTAAGSRNSGTWSEVFGSMADEAFSAWHIARYVDAVAAAGKRAYPLPMYVNNWLINPGNARAGEWPSGGPTPHVLDIWKAAAPHLDLLAPDIYLPEFERTCEEFTRPDNPLFVPETRFDQAYPAYAFLAFARFNAVGFSPFGIDGAVENSKVTERAETLRDTYRILNPLLPLIEKLQYTGKLHAIVQNVDWAQVIRLDHDLAAIVRFNQAYKLDGPWGRGSIIELAPDDYIVAGSGFRVDFRELAGPPRDAQFLSLEEGTFKNGEWQTERRLNGDELHVSLPSESRILRVRLIR